MKKRIFAWVLLAGFVLLLLNLIVFRFYWQLSMVVYLIIMFAFLFTNGRLVNTHDTDDISGSDGSDDHHNKDIIGKYLDDAVVLKKEAGIENNESNVADDSMNVIDDHTAMDDNVTIGDDDVTEGK